MGTIAPEKPIEEPTNTEEPAEKEWEVRNIVKAKTGPSGETLYQVKFEPTWEEEPENIPYQERIWRKVLEKPPPDNRPKGRKRYLCYWMDEWLPAEDIHPLIIQNWKK